jgi:hypothetical protein
MLAVVGEYPSLICVAIVVLVCNRCGATVNILIVHHHHECTTSQLVMETLQELLPLLRGDMRPPEPRESGRERSVTEGELVGICEREAYATFGIGLRASCRDYGGARVGGQNRPGNGGNERGPVTSTAGNLEDVVTRQFWLQPTGERSEVLLTLGLVIDALVLCHALCVIRQQTGVSHGRSGHS